MTTVTYRYYSDSKIEGEEIEEEELGEPGFRLDYDNRNVFHRCCECNKIVAFDPGRVYDYGSPWFKLSSCLKCPHCNRWYCSYKCMEPRLLIPNSRKIDPITGVKMCKIHKLCDMYIKSLRCVGTDPFFDACDVDCGREKWLKHLLGFKMVFYIEDRDALEAHVCRYFNDAEKNKCPDFHLERCLWIFIGCKNCLI